MLGALREPKKKRPNADRLIALGNLDPDSDPWSAEKGSYPHLVQVGNRPSLAGCQRRG
jgi:hypothetical protein